MNRENMESMNSPDDPLFYLHHTNIDRMWAIWQDYWGHTEVDPYDDQEFTTPEFYRSSGPRYPSMWKTVYGVDYNMHFQIVRGENVPFFNKPNGETPTLRDMHKRYVKLSTSQTSSIQ
jgi:hypothetical protein